MKKLLTICAALFAFTTAQASHMLGADITIKQLNAGMYELHLSTYYDSTLPIPPGAAINYQMYDGNSQLMSSGTFYVDSATSFSLLPGYPYGVRHNNYYDTVQFAAVGSFRIEWTHCCRNGGIDNMQNSNLYDMHLESTWWVDPNGSANSSPVFLSPPVSYLPVNTPWTYNPVPFDPDGDSLWWEIDTCLSGHNVNIPTYTDPFSDPSNPFSIDPVTGIISWTANIIGRYAASVVVHEYRNGMEIGSVRREMYFEVTPAQSSLPTFPNFSNIPLNLGGYPELYAEVGQNFSYTFLGSDSDSGDSLYFYAHSGAFDLATNPATWSTSWTASNSVEGTLNWTPDLAAMNGSPYLLGLRLADYSSTADEAVLLSVISTVDIEEPKAAKLLAVFPNPAADRVNLQMTLPNAEQVNIVVRDLQGRVVMQRSKMLAAGQHLVAIEQSLANGTYLLEVNTPDGRVGTQKLVIFK